MCWGAAGLRFVKEGIHPCYNLLALRAHVNFQSLATNFHLPQAGRRYSLKGFALNLI